MNVSLMLFLRKMWRVIFDIFVPESYGSYLELLFGICTISWIHPSWARLLTSNMDFTPNMDFTGDSCQGKQKQKQKAAPHRQKVLMSCEWAWAEKTSLARILSLHWLEGMRTQLQKNGLVLEWSLEMDPLPWPSEREEEARLALCSFFWFFLSSSSEINLS